MTALTCPAPVPRPGDRLPRRVRDQPRHDDRQRGAARPRPAAGRDDPRPAVDRRRLQPRLRGAGADRRLAGRPVRSPTGAAASAWAASPSPAGSGRSCGSAGRADRRAVRDGRVRRDHLPDHAVDHHQRLPRPPRAGQGDRRLGRGHRSRRRGRPGHRRTAARALTAGRRCSSRSCRSRCSPWSRRFVLGARVARPGAGPARPARAARCRRPRSACSSTRSSRRPAAAGATPLTIGGFALAAVLAAAFVAVERRRGNPMIDVSLFRTPAFSAASGAVTVAFFALFGFIFLVTQYFQFIRGYGTLVDRRAHPAGRDHDRARVGRSA